MPQFNAFGKTILIFVGMVLLWGLVIEPLIKDAKQATRQREIATEKAEFQVRQDTETPVQKSMDPLAYSDTPIAEEVQSADDDPGLNKILYLELSGVDVAERAGLVPEKSVKDSVPSLTDSKKKWMPYYEDNVSESYLDVTSIQTVGEIRRYRTVLNFRQRLTQVMSVISYHEMHCEAQKLRWTKSASYAQPFGLGQIVSTTTPRDFDMDPEIFSPLKNEVLKEQYNVVCK